MFKSKKASKSHSAAFWVIGAMTFAIEGMLGINAAFLVDQSVIIVAKNMLDGTQLVFLSSGIALTISLLFGASLIAGGLWTFSGFIDSLDDGKAYIREYHTGRWPVRQYWLLLFAIVAVDVSTLSFRAAYFAEKGQVSLLFFFVILILLPPILGAIVHVSENTPRERRLAKVRNAAVVQETDDVVRLLRTMDEDLRALWIDGNQKEALEEHYRRVADERKESDLYERQQMEAKAEGDRKKGIGNATHPLVEVSLLDQAK